MKSDEIINMEIALLAELAKLVPEAINGVPDNSRNVIAAQIDVLAHRLNSDQVHDGYMATAPDDMFLDLLHASDWAHGLLSPEYDSPPSMEWRDVVKYEDGAELVDERAQAALLAALQGNALERSKELSEDIRHSLDNYDADGQLMNDPELIAASKAAVKRLVDDRTRAGLALEGGAK